MTMRMRISTLLSLGLLLLCASAGRAHEFTMDAVMNAFVRVDGNDAHLVVRAPLFLFKQVRFPVKGAEVDLANAGPAMERALGALQDNVALFADGKRLAATSSGGRLSLPSDRSFETYDRAVEHVATAHDPGIGIYVDQGFIDARFSYALPSPDARLSVRTSVAPDVRDYLKLVVRYMPSSGETRTMVISSTSGTVELDPTWLTAVRSFVGFGISHIVTGFDHLLFLLCLLMPLRGIRQIVTIVTGFTLAHSVTLIGSAFGFAPEGAWFPPFVEIVIAVSIVYTALENIVGVDLRRRLVLTMLFGLVHGFGFSYGLREELQFAGSHLLVSLFAFNLGVEIGQLAMVALMLPVLALVSRYVLPGRVGAIIVSALVAHVGWHWTTERWEALAAAKWPMLDLAGVTVALLWLGALAIGVGIVVNVSARLRLQPLPQRPAPRSEDLAPGD
jgi:HupE / UreJ protein